MATMDEAKREKVYEEKFISPPVPTQLQAEKVLHSIRKYHSSAFGWEGISGYTEQLPDGTWVAVREHVKYR